MIRTTGISRIVRPNVVTNRTTLIVLLLSE